ncbi:Aste57867_3712 [Aphanomyces stellatus]|uniref:Aste57867_3712 protein n=1 Tax=Aphanomyces stellatus TaxID=120398 RepID=A0A485KB92_9STRA|nr:hypothetical protein As57867_003701 [Aphanomyces stellatus]VFT80866.1 Aste57867_3712 [Aphanomyces stellatus]
MAIGRNLSAVERRGAYEMLLARSEHGVLPYGNSGAKRKRTADEIEQAIKAVPHDDRQTLRCLEVHSGIKKTTIIRHMKEKKKLKAKSNYVKPLLTQANKMTRLRFALNCLLPGPRGTHFFENMYNRVHIDEKWFFLTKVKNRFYVYEDEAVALRACKSKRFITKVMFLAAVARPRYDPHRRCVFDGKLGIWPFVKHVAAVRNSKNRPKGTIITKPQNVDAHVYFDCVIDNVVPAIVAKFPRACLNQGVYIQHDNAGPHQALTTKLLRSYGVNGISMLNQPANSPDFNVLDLGFFNAIQSLQHQKRTRTIEQLVGAVESAFNELPVETLAKTFVTLQKMMELSLINIGGNNFKLPHMKKDAVIEDLSTFKVQCAATTIAEARAQLNCHA